MKLDNPRHEVFAQEIAKGTSAAQAYVRAGYAAHTGNASKLAREKSVSERVVAIQVERRQQDEEATERATAALGLTKEWVLDRLRENVERSMQAVEIRNADGGTGEYKYDGAVANRALELIGKELRMFVDRSESEVTQRYDVSDRPDPAAAEAEWSAQVQGRTH